MAKTLNIAASFYGSLLLLISLAHFTEADINITTFGADPSGYTDSTQAIMAAWTAACESGVRERIVVPEGKYLVTGQVALSGEDCATLPYEFYLGGTLVAPPNTSAFTAPTTGWINLYKLYDFTLSGSESGLFDGNGYDYWSNGNCSLFSSSCTTLSIDSVTNLLVSNISIVNSKMFNIGLYDCKTVTLQDLNITAPWISPNTDGIHVARSEDINILGATIMTGDDCVSIGDGSNNVTVAHVSCGPGHGISIGSLGRYQDEKPVTGVTVTNCTLTGTTNGVRLKAMLGTSISTTVSDVVFQNIRMVEVQNPIVIDQDYCPHLQCDSSAPSLVKITNVRFDKIQGTSATEEAIILNCSSESPCQTLLFSEIDLTYNEGQAKTVCRNALDLQFNSTQNPTIACGGN